MGLRKIEEIERAISGLTAQERQELYARLDQSYVQPIDLRIEGDFASGRLDAAMNRALDQEQNGSTRPL
ncbi:MAG TPA: hypothetical protein VG267_07900 [Terracidiphilus sp.]|jgi:hypothetical protein|nr:hypothetical protein [Terracidiphilus sp.]